MPTPKRRVKVYTPTPDAPSEAKRREFTLFSIRLYGARLLEHDERRSAWMVAWRRHEAGLGPLPIDPDILTEAIAEWPSRSLYEPALRSWQPPAGMRPYDPLDIWR
jgi:hypothetical protein